MGINNNNNIQVNNNSNNNLKTYQSRGELKLTAVDILASHHHRKGNEEGPALWPLPLHLLADELEREVDVEGGAWEGGAVGGLPAVPYLNAEGHLGADIFEVEGVGVWEDHGTARRSILRLVQTGQTGMASR